jgi:hypothetical protein
MIGDAIGIELEVAVDEDVPEDPSPFRRARNCSSMTECAANWVMTSS